MYSKITADEVKAYREKHECSLIEAKKQLIKINRLKELNRLRDNYYYDPGLRLNLLIDLMIEDAMRSK